MIKNWIKVTVVLAMCLTACSDESELSNGELPAEQAKESLDQLSGQMQDDVVDMVSSNGIDALLDLIAFIEISDPFNGRAINDSKAVVNQLASGIQNVAKSFNTKSKFAPNANEEEFSLSDYFGVYEWDTTSEMFVKTDEVVEYVELRFPVNESATNNGAFRIIKLEEQHFVEEYITLPTAILAELYVDGNLSASLNFAANYSSIGFPENIAASLFLDPFTYDLAFSWDTSGQVSASLNVSKGSDQIFNVSISANIADQNTDNLQSLELSLSYRNFKIAGTIDAPLNEDVEDINELINMSVYEGEEKIGDLEIEIDPNTDEVKFWVVLADGTKVDLEEILQPAIDEIEDIIVALGED